MDTSKSVVAKRINQLEASLELELLQRSTRRLSITDTGTALYERTLPILAELDEAKAEVSSVEWGLSGTFRISCISSFTARYLARDLCEFQSQHENLRIEMQQHDRFCDPVQEGFDICLQPEAQHGGHIEVVEVLPLRRMAVATPAYLSKHGIPQHPSELINHRFAHNHHISPSTSIEFFDGNKLIQGPIAPIILTNTGWQLRAAVLWGDCIAMLPTLFMEDELASGEMVPILPQYRVRRATLSAYFRKTPFVPMKIRIFLNFLRQKYSSFPPWERRLLELRPELAGQLGPRNKA